MREKESINGFSTEVKWLPRGDSEVINDTISGACYACLEKQISQFCDSTNCVKSQEGSYCALCEDCWDNRINCQNY